MIRKLAIGLLSGSLLAGIYLDGMKNTPIYVREGTVGYSENKPIESKGFYRCSAAILDCGNKAVYAHLRPTEEDRLVDEIMEVSKKHGFEKEKCFAVINAGTESSLYELKSLFKKRGIEVKLANMDLSLEKGKMHPRKVMYDPTKDQLNICRGIEKKTMFIPK